jgi:elongation factor P
MASIQATRLKKGMLIKLGNDLFRVLDLQHFTPGNKRGFVQARMRNIRTGQQADNKFRAEDDVERAHLEERQMQYLYRDGDSFHFMDTNTYEQIHLDTEVLGDNASYILPEMVIAMEFYGEEPVGIELPITVDLKVVDTTPGINRATASAQVKPATLETGLVVNVPAHVNIGDVIRVGTEDGEYQKKL